MKMIRKKQFFLMLRIFILICPLLYGFMGRLFSPFFFLVLLLFVWSGFKQPRQDPEYPFRRKIGFLFYGFMGFLLLQAVPLPLFLLRRLSPAAVRALEFLADKPPAFHPISLLPFDTLIFAAQLAAAVLFFRMILSVKWEKQEMISLLFTILMSALLVMFAGITGILDLSRRHFSLYLVMVFPLAPTLLLMKLRFLESSRGLVEKFLSRVSREKTVIIFSAIVPLLTAGVLLTRSRAALLSFLVSGLLFCVWAYYFKRPRAVRKRLRTAFVIGAVLAVLIGLQATAQHLLRSRSIPVSQRAQWSRTLSMIKTYPLAGAGFGTRQSADLLYHGMEKTTWRARADNGFLEILAEGGIIGGGLFLLLIAAIGGAVIIMWRRRKHPQVKIIGLGIIIALFAAAFHSIFNTSLRVPHNLLVFLLLLSLAIKIATYKRDGG
ncbi:MAG: O-antigen ligase family protein [bacterium]|nr:O-antigen ligase family protein [bacterium]